MIRFMCPSCKKPLQVGDQMAGAALCCPHCKTQMRAPQAVPAAPRPAAPNQAIAARPPAAPPTAPRPTAPPPAAMRPPQPPPQSMPAPAGAISPRANPAPAPTLPSAPPPAPPVPDISGPAWKVTLHKVGRGSAVAGKWVATEVARTSKATFSQTMRLVSYGSNRWRARSLRGREQKAELVLGERLMQAGSGHPQLRQQIAALDATIQTAEAAKQPTKLLRAQRQQLLYQLAATALSQPAMPPGAENEVKQVQEMRAALKRRDVEVQTSRAALRPPDRATWLRVGVGYACFGVAVVLAAGGFSPFSSTTSTTSNSVGGSTPGDTDPAPIVKLDTSVKFIPEDAAFYASFMRNREQVDNVRRSNFWQRLSSNESVQGAWQMFANQQGGPWQQFQIFRAAAENRELIELIEDSWGDEIFVYGADNCTDSARIVKRGGFGLIQALLQPNAVAGSNKQVVAFLKEMSTSSDRLRVPDLVIGFRLSKPENAPAGLKRLETLLRNKVWDSDSEMARRLRWEKVAGNDFLVFSVDGGMVDWERTPLLTQADQGELTGLVNKLRQARITLSLGVRDRYLLLGIGESTAHLEKLGQGRGLADRPELRPLAAQGDKRFVRIGYESRAFRNETSYLSPTKKDWADSSKRFQDEVLPGLPVDENKKKQIAKDIDDFFKDLQATTSDPGAMLSFTFLNERGLESYDYDWTDNHTADGSRPLTLLDHIGGDPLLASVSRSRSRSESYQRLVKWTKVLYGYVEEQALKTLPGQQQQLYQMVFTQMKPLLERLDQTTGQQLLPSLQDGQVAWVFDGKLRSKQAFPGIPPAPNPLPLPEAALVLGVSNADQLRQAGADYLSIANGVAAVVQKTMGQPVNSNMIPPPQTASINGGQLYYYSLPPLPGLNEHWLPCAGLSDQVLALGLSRDHAERLLATKAPNAGLLQTNRPLSSAFWVNWAGLVDFAGPWIEYTSKNPNQLRQAREVMEFLKVLRNYSSVTYFEEAGGGRAEVTHSAIVLQDLPQ